MNAGRRLSLLIVVIAAIGVVAIALLYWGIPSAPVDLGRRLAAPGSDAWLGTDQLGRDLGRRLVLGAPWSLGVAVAATLIAAFLGIAVGLAAGELDGIPRRALLQLVNLTLSFPGLVAAMAAVAILGQSNTAVFLVLGLLSWPVFARVCYAETLTIKERAYVMAARIGGVRRHVLLWRHVLPALAPSLIAMVAFHFAEMLVASSALSFLGIGAPLGSPAWGAMLSESRPYLYQAPWMLVGPAAALAGTVLALNLWGDFIARSLGGEGRIGVRA